MKQKTSLKTAKLQAALSEAQRLTSEAIREGGKPQLAQLVAHLGACKRVLNEIKNKDD